MREILFRGKRSDNNVWVEGYYLFLNGEEEKLHIIVDERGIYNKVIPETVGQYTGLTDMNGKKIFEGDIHRNGENLFVVKYGEFYDDDISDHLYGWYFKRINRIMIHRFTLQGNEHDYVEIIGNIHDNPELLKGGD